MGIRENKIERYLNNEFVRRGGITRKWVSPGYDGVPDRICILNGLVWFVEIKTTDGVISMCQARESKRISDAGCTVYTVYGISGVNNLMQEIDDGLNK